MACGLLGSSLLNYSGATIKAPINTLFFNQGWTKVWNGCLRTDWSFGPVYSWFYSCSTSTDWAKELNLVKEGEAPETHLLNVNRHTSMTAWRSLTACTKLNHLSKLKNVLVCPIELEMTAHLFILRFRLRYIEGTNSLIMRFHFCYVWETSNGKHSEAEQDAATRLNQAVWTS